MPQLTWSQITALPQYKVATLAEREKVRQSFYNDFVATAPEDIRDQITKRWDEATNPLYGAKGSGSPDDPFEFDDEGRAKSFLSDYEGKHWVKLPNGAIANKDTTFFEDVAGTVKRGLSQLGEGIRNIGPATDLEDATRRAGYAEAGGHWGGDARAPIWIPADPEDAEPARREQVTSLAEIGKNRSESSKAQSAVPRSYNRAEFERDTGEAKGFGESLDAILKNPGAAFGQAGESAVVMLPALTVGALSRNPALAAIVAGVNSGGVEYASGVADYLQQQGIDVGNEEQMANIPQSTLNDALSYAKTRAAIIGTIDAVSGGLSSKVIVPSRMARSFAAREAANMVVQTGADAAAGAGGELAAQVATGQERDWNSVLMEALGEGITKPAEVAAHIYRRASVAADPAKASTDELRYNAQSHRDITVRMASVMELVQRGQEVDLDTIQPLPGRTATPMPTMADVEANPDAGKQGAAAVIEQATANTPPLTKPHMQAPLMQPGAPIVAQPPTVEETAAIDTGDQLADQITELDKTAATQLPLGQRKELEHERGEILAAVAEHDEKLAKGIVLAPADRIDDNLRAVLNDRVTEINQQITQHKAAVSAATQAADLRAKVETVKTPAELVKVADRAAPKETPVVPAAPLLPVTPTLGASAAPAPAQAALGGTPRGIEQIAPTSGEEALDAALNRMTETQREVVNAPLPPVTDREGRRQQTSEVAGHQFRPAAQQARKKTSFARVMQSALIGLLDEARGQKNSHKMKKEDRAYLDQMRTNDLSLFQEVELTGKDRWFVKQVEQAIGKRVVFISGTDANGNMIPEMHMLTHRLGGWVMRESPDVLFVSTDSVKSPMAVIGHEFLHLLRVTAPELYQEFVDVAAARLLNTSQQAKDRLLAYKELASQDAMHEELFADFWGDLFNDEQFWQSLAKREPTMFQQVMKTMLDFLSKLVDRTGHKSDKMFKDVKAIREKAEDIFVRYSKEYVRGTVEESVAVQQDKVRARKEADYREAFKTPTNNDEDSDQDGEMSELMAFSRGRPRMSREPEQDGMADVSAESSIDQHKIAQLLGAQLYNEMPEMASVTIKELAQNAFDAIKGAVERGTLKDGEGKISIDISYNQRTVTITDNADGMDADIINKHFLQIGGSKKNTSRPSGGFGIAKMLFLYGSEKLTLTSVRNGVETTFETTGKRVMASLSGGQAGVIRRQATNKPSGTSVTVTIPSTYVNADGEEKNIYSPSTYTAKEVLNKSPLFENIEVTVDDEVLPVGKAFDNSELKLISRAKFPWGSASIMIRPRNKSDGTRDNFIILSNGIYQFAQTLKKNPFDWNSEPLPFVVYMNAEPAVEAADPRYPFSMNRQGVKESLKADFAAVQKYISALYANRDNSEQIKSFGTMQTIDKNGSLHEVSLAIPEGDTSGMLDLTPDTEVTIEDGKMVIGGREVPELTAEAMRKVQVNPSQHAIDQSQLSPEHAILHDNMVAVGIEGGGMIGAARKALGEKHVNAYLLGLSNVFADLRDATAAEFPYKYADKDSPYKDVRDVPVGISIDPGYYGVSTNLPFRAMLLNPALNRYMSSNTNAQEQAGRTFVGTMIHEIVHHVEKNHSETGYIPALSELNTALAMSGATVKAVNKVQHIVDRYADVYNWFIQENSNGNFKSAGLRLEDSEREDAAGAAGAGDAGRIRSASVTGRDAEGGRASAGTGSQAGTESGQRQGAYSSGRKSAGAGVTPTGFAGSRQGVPRPQTGAQPRPMTQSPIGIPVRNGYGGKVKSFVQRAARKIEREFLDAFVDLKRLQDYVEQQIGTQLPPWAQPWRAENLRHGAFVDKREIAMREYFEPVAELLESNDYNRHEFEDYLWSRHVGERDAFLRSKLDPNIPAPTYLAGMTPQEAQAHLASIPADKLAVFEQAATHMDGLRKHILDVLVQSGQMSADHRDELLDQYEYYVPLRGLPDGSDPDLSNSGLGTSKGMSMRSPLGKRATGRVSPPSDILEELAHDLDRALIGAEKQVVLKQLIAMIALHPDKALWEVTPVVPKRQWVNGVLTITDTKGDPTSQLTYMHNGTPLQIEVREPHVKAALLGMNDNNLGAVLRFVGGITRWLSSVKTALNPYFIFPNAVRDMQFALIGLSAEQGRRVMKDAMKNYTFGNPWGALRQDLRGMTMAQLRTARPMVRYAREFAAQGGKTGYTMTSDIAQQRKDLSNLFVRHSTNKMSARTAKKAWVKTFDMIENTNAYIENATRLATYAALRQNGIDPKTAAEYAKNITVNFNRKGASARQMSAAYLFFNPAVQGSVRLYRLAKNPKAQAIFGGLALASFSLALYSMHEMGDDDDGENKYDKLVGENAAARSLTISLGDEDKLQIPMAYGPNIFTHLGYVTAQAVYRAQTGKAVRGGELASAALGNLVGSMSPLPAERGLDAWKPEIIRIYSNLESNEGDFKGSKINYQMNENDKDKHDANWTKTGPATGEAYTRIAQALNALTGGDTKGYEGGVINPSGEHVKYAFAQALGGPAKFVSESYEFLENMYIGDKDELKASNVPVINSFVRNTPEREQGRPAYYRNLEEFSHLKNSYKKASGEYNKDTGNWDVEPDAEKLAALLEEHPWLEMADQDASTKAGKAAQSGTVFEAQRESDKAIKALRDERERVAMDKDSDLLERHRRMRELDAEIGEWQKTFNREMNRARGEL